MQLIDVLLIMFNCGKNCILGSNFCKKDEIPPYWAWQNREEWHRGLPTENWAYERFLKIFYEVVSENNVTKETLIPIGSRQKVKIVT